MIWLEKPRLHTYRLIPILNVCNGEWLYTATSFFSSSVVPQTCRKKRAHKRQRTHNVNPMLSWCKYNANTMCIQQNGNLAMTTTVCTNTLIMGYTCIATVSQVLFSVRSSTSLSASQWCVWASPPPRGLFPPFQNALSKICYKKLHSRKIISISVPC